ncbi:MAG TPA: NAD-dependent epimerase/dehydratase family protein [Anaerolineae bacterium]|nr:NAD-dependent epimerase/dehydratase family protein [Anaerolineae bacterium]HID84964.1 NAD-dependent epimerase/dehydratase family protein [Anaerolineales bacterium]HIQ09581.1 NAD-dependent epimerase/dehydratase family protein [Anaerolineaceae bacterium]
MARHYLITGGAGFIGANYAARLLRRGERVTIYDNLSRRGAERNIAWLREQFGEQHFRLVVGDVRDAALLTAQVREADVVVHLAAQVAVTTSVRDPRLDFEINALGTFNVLEAARLSPRRPLVLYASTNKVYGGMEEVAVVEEATRYRYADLPHGVPETQPLDFHSPYGCSKGAGDQYVRDYARIYGVPTVVFRQSCIYGPRQWGVEDQGWVAWFVIAAVTGRPITIYGDGKQVRDLLFVEDLLDAYDAAVDRREQVAGEVYNIGGGPQHTVSIWREFGPLLEGLLGHPVPVTYGDWRPGDQRVYISDIRKAERELGWRPQVGVEEGVRRLVAWVQANRELFV